MHRAGLQILSGEKQRQLQESITATETAAALVGQETVEIREMVIEENMTF